MAATAAVASTFKMKVVLFVGTARHEPTPWGGPARNATGVSRFAVNQLRARGHTVFVVDALELYDTFPILQKPHYWYAAGTAPKALDDIAQQIKAADAVVVVSGEYNHTIPPGLSNMMDYFGATYYAWKPAGIITYSGGPYGGVRAAMALRPFLAELSLMSVSNICSYPVVQNEFEENGTPKERKKENAEKTLGTMLAQLEWYAEACAVQRAKTGK